MLQSSRTSGCNDRNRNCIRDRSGKLNVISCLGAITIHTGKKDFTRTELLNLLGPLNGINACIQSSAMFIDIPAAILSSLGIDCNDHALTSELLCCLCDQFRTIDRRRIDRDLVCTLTEKFPEILYCTNAAAYGKRDKNIRCNLPHHIHNGITFLAGCRDIQKNKFICTCCIIGSGNLHRISCVLKIHKINAFYHPAVIYIQTGNDSFCKHFSSPPSQVLQSFRES